MPRSWLQASNNSLVIFEEIGGNPLEISVKLRSARTICGQVSESHYPPLSKLVESDFIDQELPLNNMAPEMHLHCQDGDVISSITFASYGTPLGSCQSFARGSCHSPSSLSIVSEVNSGANNFLLCFFYSNFNGVLLQACLGKKSCSVEISNTSFGGDPCHGVVKTLAVEVKCTSSSKGDGSFQL